MLRDLVLYFLKLGATGFGGPIALAAYMERDLVDRRKWFTREEYMTGLALANLMPGPMATQLAIYLGYVRGRILGATLVAIAFTLPAFICVILLAALYMQAGGLPWLHAALYGVSAAVIAIMLRSAWRLIKTLVKGKLLWLIFLGMALTTYATGKESLTLFLLCGALALAAARYQVKGLLALTAMPGAETSLLKIFSFFFKAGATVFGSGLVIVPFLYGGVVTEYGWLTDKQFLDAVAVGMLTPGPIVMSVAFIGYLTAGFWGASAAALGVFLPVYLFVVVPASMAQKLVKNPMAKAFVEGVTAAAVGALAAAVVMLANRAVVDTPTAAIAVISFLILLKTKTPEPVLILAAALAGLLIGL